MRFLLGSLLILLTALPASAALLFPGTEVVKNGTGVILTIPIVQNDAAWTPITGLVFNSAGLVAEYCRGNAASTCTGITLTGTCSLGSYTSGCFLEKDTTAGLYQIHVPDAAFATGTDRGTITVSGTTNSRPTIIPYNLVDVGLQGLATTIGTPVSSIAADIAGVQSGITSVQAGFYRKNVAGQAKVPVYLYVLGTATPYTGAANTVTVLENKDDAGWVTACAAPCGTVTGGGASGNGLFWYAPAQTDTNCNHCLFKLTAPSPASDGRYNIRTAP